MNNTLLAKHTLLSGTILEARCEYDEQYNDYVGFVRLIFTDGGQYVPMESGQPFKSEMMAKEFAMRKFSSYDDRGNR